MKYWFNTAYGAYSEINFHLKSMNLFSFHHRVILRFLMLGHNVLFNKNAPLELKQWFKPSCASSGVVTRSATRGDLKVHHNGTKYSLVTFQSFYSKLFNKLDYKIVIQILMILKWIDCSRFDKWNQMVQTN
jgi:hypothetical protein